MTLAAWAGGAPVPQTRGTGRMLTGLCVPEAVRGWVHCVLKFPPARGHGSDRRGSDFGCGRKEASSAAVRRVSVQGGAARGGSSLHPEGRREAGVGAPGPGLKAASIKYYKLSRKISKDVN